MPTPPRVLTVAGSDSGGGAGIQADLKTMLALGVHGMSVVTAVTAQDSTGVHGYWELPAEAVDAQLAAVLDDIGVDAVKTGMLASPELVGVTAKRLRDVAAPIVVDPVCVSKHGDRCWCLRRSRRSSPSCCRSPPSSRRTSPRCTRLTGLVVDDAAGQRRAADALLALGPQLGARQGRSPRRRRGRPADRRRHGRRAARAAAGQRAHPRHRLHAGLGDRVVPRARSERPRRRPRAPRTTSPARSRPASRSAPGSARSTTAGSTGDRLRVRDPRRGLRQPERAAADRGRAGRVRRALRRSRRHSGRPGGVRAAGRRVRDRLPRRRRRSRWAACVAHHGATRWRSRSSGCTSRPQARRLRAGATGAGRARGARRGARCDPGRARDRAAAAGGDQRCTSQPGTSRSTASATTGTRRCR